MLAEYWDRRDAEEVRTINLRFWLAILQDWRVDQVEAACIRWIKENPKTRPNAGLIHAMLADARGRRVAQQIAALPTPEPVEHPAITPERANEIMAEVGFRPRRMTDTPTQETPT